MAAKTAKTPDALRNALEATRLRIVEIADEIDQVEHAPITRAEASKAVDQWVKATGAACDIEDAALMFQTGEPLTDSMNPFRLSFRASSHFGEGLATGEIDLSPFFCRLMPEQVATAIKAALPADDESSISTEARAARIKELRAERRSLEVEEEVLCDRLYELTGTEPARRDDADLKLILNMAA